MAWKSSQRVEPVEMDKNVILCLFHLELSPTPWLLSAIYGPSRVSERSTFWKKMAGVKERFSIPWLMIGDLNGGRYTWRNGRRGLAFAKVRLDRALCDEQWRRLYPAASVTMHPATFSDHNPLLKKVFSMMQGKRSFKFQAAWTRDNRSSLVVKKAWISYSSFNAGTQLLGRQNNTRKALTSWNRNQFGNLQSEIQLVK
ncbi:Endonuclease/exonuclease/phosphatase [Trema orientale]|uniref:Endonuclease/exonuclease/phosphatase n=1 Tax=Trema orientale TaxID=63057 RepID=A0A2P5EZU2_TREOI|nr:Endonuclease/exonuclease/phosphatase [Trema orientale]